MIPTLIAGFGTAVARVARKQVTQLDAVRQLGSGAGDTADTLGHMSSPQTVLAGFPEPSWQDFERASAVARDEFNYP
jgi:hypothetical protein